MTKATVVTMTDEQIEKAFGPRTDGSSWREIFARIRLGEVLLIGGHKEQSIRSSARAYRLPISMRKVDGGFAVRLKVKQ